MIDRETHERLKNWARWCRSGYLPAEFWVGCQSAEADSVSEAGAVLETTAERLDTALRAGSGPYDEKDAAIIEIEVLRSPPKMRMILRLHYVTWRSIPMSRKRKLLGVSDSGYWDLLELAARRLS